MRYLIIIAAIACLPLGPARAEASFDGLNLALTDRVVVPAYERMAEEMAALSTVTGDFCAEPDSDGLGVVETAFHRAMEAWQRAQPIAFGPVTREGRASRVQFWPDKRGTAGRQIGRALQKQDPALLAPGGLDGKSVALQNLAAFERIVFGRGKALASAGRSGEDRYACALAAAIARFQARLATTILEDWTKAGGFREVVRTAGAGNARFGSADEATTAFLASITVSLEIAIRLKLDRPMGKEIAKARPKRAESWRSGRSLANIIANLETGRLLFEAPGGFGDLLQEDGEAQLDVSVRKSFAESIDLARAIPPPLHEAVGDTNRRLQLIDLRYRLANLHHLVAELVAGELDLVIGFNALDGD